MYDNQCSIILPILRRREGTHTHTHTHACTHTQLRCTHKLKFATCVLFSQAMYVLTDSYMNLLSIHTKDHLEADKKKQAMLTAMHHSAGQLVMGVHSNIYYT